MLVEEQRMQHTKFQGHRPFGSEEEDCLRFLAYMGWRPSGSCDLNHLNELSFSHPKNAPYEI